MTQRPFTFHMAVGSAVLLAACGGGSKNDPPPEPQPIAIAQTGQSVSKAAGDDAALRRGVAWPSPRFTKSDDGTVVDHLTGLAWAGNNAPVAECGWTFTDQTKDTKTWQQALAYVACLNGRKYLGHADWRVPNRWEMRSLLQNDGVSCDADARLKWLQAQGFQFRSADPAQNLVQLLTSTPIPSRRICVESGNKRLVWSTSLCGETSADPSDSQMPSRGVWPVRDAEGVEAAVKLPATGVTACYDWTGCARIDCAGTGQDGETRKGAAWPSPRFVTNPDTTVTDRLTNLVWAPNGNLPNPDPAATPSPRTWLGALGVIDYLNGQTYLGHADWRLPNINELMTLALGDIEDADLVDQLEAGGLHLKTQDYWSSTSGTKVESSSQDVSWTMSTVGGGQYLTPAIDTSAAQLLPVRGP